MTESNTIKVMLVDDHPIVRDGLRSVLLITDDLVLVGEASDGQRALAKCRKVQPDVILMDIVMPGMGGVEATRTILSHYPDIRIVVLTTFPDDRLVQEAIEAGATSYLLKNTPADGVIDAIRAAHAGESVLSPEATRALMGIRAGRLRLGDDLSPREKEVLALMIEGLTNGEIADRLVISIGTVRHHVSACISKLGAANRTHAVALAMEHNLTR